MQGKNISRGAQRAKYVVMDFIMSSLAFFLFNIIRYEFLDLGRDYDNSITTFLFNAKLIAEQIAVPVGLLGLYWLSGYYNQSIRKSRLVELTTTIASNFTATLLLFFILLINDTTGVKLRDYELLIILFGLLFAFTYSGRRYLTFQTIKHLRARQWIYSTLIIGNSKRSRQIYRKLRDSGSEWAYDVVGFIRLKGEPANDDVLPVWEWDEVEEVYHSKKIDQIILAPDNIRDLDIIRILKRLFPLNCPVKIAPDTLSYVTGNIRLDDIQAIPFIDLTSPRISEYQKNVKRTLDVAISIAALLLFSPVIAAAAIGVKLSSAGPIIYRQERIGKGRKPFYIYKFRSMRTDAEKSGPQLSREDDDRITGWGRIMRKYRIDEIPQFWNIIRGDMSLVGPRPERAYYIEQIVSRAPYYGLIFQVRPGLTSWGMVKHGYASSVDEMVARSRYDLLYLNNMSLITDFKIIIYTVNTVLKGAGV
ncbi:MAG: sugar transferase [Muribaculaceae bacterium]|nr:sugar transferase [Muribaculaceae bacterium]